MPLTPGEKKLLSIVRVKHAKTFKWMALLFSLYLIVIGSMLVYESANDPIYDVAQNNGLIGVGGVAIALSVILLIALVYVEKQYPDVSLKFYYSVCVMILFGTTVGTISVINGVDVPNSGTRGTLGWVFGGITTGVGVIGTLFSIYAVAAAHNNYIASWPLSGFLFGDTKEMIKLPEEEKKTDFHKELEDAKLEYAERVSQADLDEKRLGLTETQTQAQIEAIEQRQQERMRKILESARNRKLLKDVEALEAR